MSRLSIIVILTVAATLAQTGGPVLADVFDSNVGPRSPFKQKVLEPPKEVTMESLFPHSELHVQPVEPYPLEGTHIPGLTEAFVRQLGQHHFIVIANSPFRSMADVYRDNRLHGKPNFVTSDSIINPYIAFTNGVAVNVIARVAPDLQALLSSMFSSACAQLRVTQDASVRGDAEKNCAFLATALMLLNPDLKIALIGQANALAAQEVEKIKSGKKAISPISGRERDYSVFRPIGWYGESPQFANFYRCHQWLSQTDFVLSEPGDDSIANEFRRSLLLFQNLRDATVGGQSGITMWNRLATALDTVGCIGNREHMLYPRQYDTVLSGGQRISLNGLSEPFYRTKLLLSVRKQRPLEVDSASILSMSEQKQTVEDTITFRLFPPTDDIELGWLRERAHGYPPEGSDEAQIPLALLDLYGHGSAEAANVLADSIWQLNPELTKTLPELVRALKVGEHPPSYSMGNCRWQIFSLYFKPFADGAQAPLRTTLWLRRRLESAFAAWVDGHVSVAPLDAATANQTKPQAHSSTITAGTGKAAISSDRQPVVTTASPPAPQTGSPQASPSTAQPKTALSLVPHVAPNDSHPAKAGQDANAIYFHYLEPCPEVYRRIASDSADLRQTLLAQNYMPDGAKEKFDAFEKLCLRLAGIADRELSYRPVSASDMQLLSEFDQALQTISFPLEGCFNLNTGDGTKGGCTLGIGTAGYLHILCHTTRGMVLCRGPLYSYYEVAGGPITQAHWERKLQFGLVKPCQWTLDFDLMRQTSSAPAGEK